MRGKILFSRPPTTIGNIRLYWRMKMNRRNSAFALSIILAVMIACGGPSKQKEEPLTDTSKTMDPVQAQIQQRAEELSKELSRQKEIKASIKDMPLIEKFTRTTSDKDVAEVLGKPDKVKDVLLDDIQQRVFLYNQQKYA